MIASRSTEQAGWALPTTIFALTIMLSTIYALSLESIDALQIAREPHRSERLHSVIANTARDPRTSNGRCENLAVLYEEKMLPYEVCRESVRPFVTKPPSVSLPPQLIDYDILFSQASECPSIPRLTRFKDMTSPFAPHDCTLPGSLSGSMVMLDNLMGESLALSKTGPQVTTLATPGRVAISHELRLSSDLLLVAGGDVEISSIRALPSASVKVTVISALGAIRIGLVEGDVSLLIAGRGELSAPGTPATVDYPLPPFRHISLYGFRSAG